VRFLRGHLGYEIPSPALLGKIGNRFRQEVSAFATERAIPILRLKKPDRSRWDDRKLDHVRPYLERAEREGRFDVVAIVACQEYQRVLSARDRAGYGKPAALSTSRRIAGSGSTTSTSSTRSSARGSSACAAPPRGPAGYG
jgi:hypothetical protein